MSLSNSPDDKEREPLDSGIDLEAMGMKKFFVIRERDEHRFRQELRMRIVEDYFKCQDEVMVRRNENGQELYAEIDDLDAESLQYSFELLETRKDDSVLLLVQVPIDCFDIDDNFVEKKIINVKMDFISSLPERLSVLSEKGGLLSTTKNTRNLCFKVLIAGAISFLVARDAALYFNKFETEGATEQSTSQESDPSPTPAPLEVEWPAPDPTGTLPQTSVDQQLLEFLWQQNKRDPQK